MARRIRFGASLQLPSVRLAASSLEDLQPGTVLRLDIAAGAVPEWQVGGQRLCHAQAIRQGTRRAACMERPFTKVEP
jgi:hypothetical protein